MHSNWAWVIYFHPIYFPLYLSINSFINSDTFTWYNTGKLKKTVSFDGFNSMSMARRSFTFQCENYYFFGSAFICFKSTFCCVLFEVIHISQIKYLRYTCRLSHRVTAWINKNNVIFTSKTPTVLMCNSAIVSGTRQRFTINWFYVLTPNELILPKKRMEEESKERSEISESTDINGL